MDKIASLSALLTAVDTRNRITNLPGTDAIKREINHQLARGNRIAAVYIDMIGFKSYLASRGQDGQAPTPAAPPPAGNGPASGADSRLGALRRRTAGPRYTLWATAG
jgi:hypothetical protein